MKDRSRDWELKDLITHITQLESNKSNLISNDTLHQIIKGI